MGRILNVEHVGFINNIIDIYAKNKVGQYAKFLNSVPTFVTYYHRNMVQSRQDVGTGMIESELGPRSPIRFNKITNFPIFNVPQLNPQNVYDETGYDIDLDINDAVILPNTIKPHEGDYFILQFPGTKEFLFRVNNFDYNTIQSNDFYRISCDVRAIGVDLEEKNLKTQIVDTFLTVFDNIGTEDRCFLRQEDVDYINSLADLFYKLRDFFKNAFYVRDLNTFTYQTGRWSETARPIYRDDAFLLKFINESGIFFEERNAKTIYPNPGDELPEDFDFTYDLTLYAAILKRSTELLRPYCYIVTKVITMPNSIFNINHYFGESTNLFCYKQLLDKRADTCPCCTIPLDPTPGYSGGEVWYDMNPMPKCTPTWSLEDGIEYFSSKFLKAILCKRIQTDNYFELIIFNYIHGIAMQYDRAEILGMLDRNEFTFYFLPLIIYIIGTNYKEYFVSEKEIEV